MANSRDSKAIVALVLAAGSASRFGATKQTQEIDGVPLVRQAILAANEACGEHVVLVTGHDWQAVARASQPFSGFMAHNEHFEAGMGSSLALGTRSVRHTTRAIVVMLADQALVTAAHIRALIGAWSGSGNEIVATAFSDTLGAPVLFPDGCFEELAALQGDSGGKHLLNDDRFRLTTVPFEPAAVDIDTPEDLARL